MDLSGQSCKTRFQEIKRFDVDDIRFGQAIDRPSITLKKWLHLIFMPGESIDQNGRSLLVILFIQKQLPCF